MLTDLLLDFEYILNDLRHLLLAINSIDSDKKISTLYRMIEMQFGVNCPVSVWSLMSVISVSAVSVVLSPDTLL